MAVTQISRIQVRRGRKLSPSGIPQLASGEIAWAVDSQELFIGNGSVAEGAPYVGNTKILTEHDNILALISGYKFGGEIENSPVPFSVSRSFQSKLDEYVSVLDFGASGDGVVDNTQAFEIAFSQLFQNSIESYRKVLIIPNGDYVFNSNLRIPSYVILQGENQSQVRLRFNNDSGIVFVNSINGAETLSAFTSEIRPQQITIRNLTIENSLSVMSGSKDLLFEDVSIRGNYILSDPSSNQLELLPSIYWSNTKEGVEATGIRFNSCKFLNCEIAMKCDQSTLSETRLNFYNCEFDSVDTGVLLTGVQNQINNWKFDNCKFSNTANHGIYISAGSGTIIRETGFEKCGNFLNGNPAVPSVYFGQTRNNIMIDCTSDRQQSNGVTNDELSLYVPEVIGADKVSFVTRNKAFIEPYESFTPIAVFSADNKFVKINYSIVLESGDIRNGTLDIAVNKGNNRANLTDNYTYSSPLGVAVGFQNNNSLDILSISFGKPYIGSVITGTNINQGTRIIEIDPAFVNSEGLGTYKVDKVPFFSPTSVGPNYQTINFTRDTMTNIQFQARIVDNDTTIGPDTLLLEYRQLSSVRGSFGTISFDVSYGTSSV